MLYIDTEPILESLDEATEEEYCSQFEDVPPTPEQSAYMRSRMTPEQLAENKRAIEEIIFSLN